jgi:hypothetical protein
MRAATIIMQGLAWIIIAMLVIPPGSPAQDSGQTEQIDQTGQVEQTEKFTKEELAQMLAPIALYPDSLIAQLLMASTYPLEVVEAERWMRQNKNLKGDDLDAALQEKTWDPSVKSLCHFPDVLFAMSDKLDQTRKLGDAFLSQEEDVMATVQELRQKAQEQGNLKTTKEQQVIVEQEVIRIEPADPLVVYVPAYDPLCVYGPWWYPAYPPYYWYYPPGFVTGCNIGFRYGFYAGFDLFSWVWFDWPYHRIHIDRHKTRRFHRHRDGRRDFDRREWSHDPIHRKGVAYRDRRTSQRFGTRPSRISPTSPETRGYPERRIEQERLIDRGWRIDPGRGIEKQETRPSRGAIERRSGAGVRQEKTQQNRIQTIPRRDTPFSGVGNGSFERKASERGGISRQGLDSIPQRPGIIRQSPDRQIRGTGRQSGSDIRGGGFRGSGRGGIPRK